jgi:Rps23 Pro-64 3,4-dihydroxylase Tpa1-like proline 4-hydroxylase
MSPLIKIGCITARELEIVRKEVISYREQSQPARIGSKKDLNPTIRDSLLCFPPLEMVHRSRNILQSTIIQEYLGVNITLTELNEFQYLKYGPGGFYNWHQDVIDKSAPNIRGLTMSLNITDENEYEGGELLIKDGEEIITNLKKAGSYIIFPSFLQHKASVVTSGNREAIVSWVVITQQDLSYLKRRYRDREV